MSGKPHLDLKLAGLRPIGRRRGAVWRWGRGFLRPALPGLAGYVDFLRSLLLWSIIPSRVSRGARRRRRVPGRAGRPASAGQPVGRVFGRVGRFCFGLKKGEGGASRPASLASCRGTRLLSSSEPSQPGALATGCRRTRRRFPLPRQRYAAAISRGRGNRRGRAGAALRPAMGVRVSA